MTRSQKNPPPQRHDRTTRALASLALAVALLALVLAGYSVYAQQRAEQNLRELGQELQRALSPVPWRGPPIGLELDDT